MPRVRVRVPSLHIAGATRHSGEQVDVDTDVASYLTASGFVELVRSEPVVTPERAVTAETTRRTRTRMRDER